MDGLHPEEGHSQGASCGAARSCPSALCGEPGWWPPRARFLACKQHVACRTRVNERAGVRRGTSICPTVFSQTSQRPPDPVHTPQLRAGSTQPHQHQRTQPGSPGLVPLPGGTWGGTRCGPGHPSGSPYTPRTRPLEGGVGKDPRPDSPVTYGGGAAVTAG